MQFKQTVYSKLHKQHAHIPKNEKHDTRPTTL